MLSRKVADLSQVVVIPTSGLRGRCRPSGTLTTRKWIVVFYRDAAPLVLFK
ncbi:MAG: hypothetical protein AAF573_15125 [Bacteroidota bacterium]